MGGYEIPRYAREYLREWQVYDRFLRLRRSLDIPGAFILERKTRYLSSPDVPRGTDRAIQYKDGYRKVFVFWPNEIGLVKRSLELSDIQRRGGAKEVARQMETHESRERDLMERAHQSDLEAASSDAYDFLAWREGRRVSLGGYE